MRTTESKDSRSVIFVISKGFFRFLSLKKLRRIPMVINSIEATRTEVWLAESLGFNPCNCESGLSNLNQLSSSVWQQMIVAVASRD